MEINDADLVAIFIAKNEMRYRQPINDPIFAAHRRADTVSDQQRGGNITYYKSDFPISALGCTLQVSSLAFVGLLRPPPLRCERMTNYPLQYQFCHAQAAGKPDFCSSLTGIPSLPFKDMFNASSVQVAAMQELAGIMFETDIRTASLDLKVQKLAGNFERLAYLPDDQWVQEVVGWESFLWAHLQTSMVEYAIGKSVRLPDAAPLVKSNLTDGEHKLCGKQKMGNPGGFV
jgi:hypothetical protein